MNKNLKKYKFGFTLVEITISTAIVSLLALIMMYVFRNNLTTMKWGQKHMDLQYKTQVLIKQFYNDIKKINPYSVAGIRDVYLELETKNTYHPALVKIVGKVNRDYYPIEQTEFTEEGYRGKALFFRHRSLRHSDVTKFVYWYADEVKRLYRTFSFNDQPAIDQLIAANVLEVYFYQLEDDEHAVRMTCKIQDDKDPKHIEDIDITVRFENDMIVTRLDDVN